MKSSWRSPTVLLVSNTGETVGVHCGKNKLTIWRIIAIVIKIKIFSVSNRKASSWSQKLYQIVTLFVLIKINAIVPFEHICLSSDGFSLQITANHTRHRGRTHCAWVDNWTSGLFFISGHATKAHVNIKISVARNSKAKSKSFRVQSAQNRKWLKWAHAQKFFRGIIILSAQDYHPLFVLRTCASWILKDASVVYKRFCEYDNYGFFEWTKVKYKRLETWTLC